MEDEIPEAWKQLWKQAVSPRVVAEILMLIAAPPNKREKPLAGDREGNFDFWFDGGACQVRTGSDHYELCDNTVVEVRNCDPILGAHLRFADGRQVEIRQILKE